MDIGGDRPLTGDAADLSVFQSDSMKSIVFLLAALLLFFLILVVVSYI
jgi:hypothetical protein